MKKYTVYIEQDEDGVYIGSVPTVPGCYAQGHTLDELVHNLREVVTLCSRNTDTETSNRFIGVRTIELA